MSVLAQTCGIVMVIILLFFFKRQKQLHLHAEQAFFRLVCWVLLCLCLDISSIIVIDRRYILPPWFVELVAKSYIVTLPLTVAFATIYVYSDFYSKNLSIKKFQHIYTVMGFIDSAVIFLAPIRYHENEAGVVLYTEGPSVILTYISVAVYMLFLVYHTVRNRHLLNKKRIYAVWDMQVPWES